MATTFRDLARCFSLCQLIFWTQSRSRFRIWLLPYSPFHHLVLEQATFKRAVEERRPFRGGEMDELRQPHVGAQKISAPTAEFFLQHIPKLRIELRQFPLFAETHSIGRIGDNDPFFSRRGDVQDVRLFETDNSIQTGSREVGASRLQCRAGAIAAVDRKEYLGFLPGRALLQ